MSEQEDTAGDQQAPAQRDVCQPVPGAPLCEWQDHDRRRDHMEWCHNVDRRLDEGATTMQGLHAAIAENTTATNNIKADTSELVALLNSFRGAFRVLEMIGKAARPIGFIAVAVASVVGAFKAVVGLLSVFKGGPPAP